MGISDACRKVLKNNHNHNSMTVKKVIKMLDWWIDQRKMAIEDFKKNWDYKTEVEEVAKVMLQSDETSFHIIN